MSYVYYMIAVSILMFPEAVPSSITGIIDLLKGANRHPVHLGKAPVFTLELVSRHPADLPLTFPAEAIAHRPFKDATPPGLIIIPSFSVGNTAVLDSSRESLSWIKDMHESGVENAGYDDIKTFRMIFKRVTGLSPQEYKKKYARNN
jgi:hypothetical protein